MIKVECRRCNQELHEPGGLIFSPPSENDCSKWHLCRECYIPIMVDILNYSFDVREFQISDEEWWADGYAAGYSRLDRFQRFILKNGGTEEDAIQACVPIIGG